MGSERALDLALDLARMPAFAPAMAASALPDDVVDVIRIAAGAPEACRAGALSTGQTEAVLIDAARFYVQQILLAPDADCHRVLGIRAGDSREAARGHMRWLLLWLHPDRNSGWDAVYAKRIVEAWRELSSRDDMAQKVLKGTQGKRRRFSAQLRPPLIKWPLQGQPGWSPFNRYIRSRSPAVRVAAGVIVIILLLAVTALVSSSGRTFSDTSW